MVSGIYSKIGSPSKLSFISLLQNRRAKWRKQEKIVVKCDLKNEDIHQYNVDAPLVINGPEDGDILSTTIHHTINNNQNISISYQQLNNNSLHLDNEIKVNFHPEISPCRLSPNMFQFGLSFDNQSCFGVDRINNNPQPMAALEWSEYNPPIMETSARYSNNYLNAIDSHLSYEDEIKFLSVTDDNPAYSSVDNSIKKNMMLSHYEPEKSGFHLSQDFSAMDDCNNNRNFTVDFSQRSEDLNNHIGGSRKPDDDEHTSLIDLEKPLLNIIVE